MATGAKCERCGAEVDAGARYCKRCGEDVSGQQGGVATQHVNVSATQQIQARLLTALRDATLGDYEVYAELGRGGMATVFLAHDIQLDRKVAIKVMDPTLVHGEGMVERFKLEARTAAGLSHPHIIPIYAVKETNDLLYFVMKFIDGRALDSIIEEAAPLPVPMVRTVVTKVGEALGYAHRRGVIHRDIKPANIMIDTEGMPIVTDFGIAKVADTHGLTMTGATIGTPTYMSPEQCSALDLTGASDQYSLGVLAYEMLTGKPLFDGDSVMTIMYKHCHEERPSPASLGDNVPPDLSAALMKMVEKDPGDRWESIEAALPHIGGGALAYDDSVRTQLIEFATQGEHRDILKSISTPRSPIPARGADLIESAATVRLSSGSQVPAPAPTGAVPSKKRRVGLWVGLGGVAVAAIAAAAMMLGPFAGRGEPIQAGAPPPTGPPAGDATLAAGAGAVTAQDPAAVAGSTVPAEPAVPPPVRRADARQGGPVGPGPVQLVLISGAPASMPVGQTVKLTAVPTDANGQLVQQPARWSSSNLAVARITSAGMLQAVSPGNVTITVAVGGRSNQVAVTVSELPVAAVTVMPAQDALEVGGSVQLAARVTASDGSSLAGRQVTWNSSDPAVAAVTAAGAVTGVGPGSAVITATSGGPSGISRITVTAPVVAVDNRVLIEETIQAYARAIEASDINAVRRVYPGIPSNREEALRNALRSMRDVRVALSVGSVDIDGDVAHVAVTGRWTFFNTASRSNQDLPADNQYVLQRRSDRWVITEIR